MKEQRFPAGWGERRMKRLPVELDARTEEEWIAADEAAAAGGSDDQTVVTVPTALLPEIRRLIASHKTA